MTVEPLDRGLFLIPLDLHAGRLSDNLLSVSYRRLSCGQGRGSAPAGQGLASFAKALFLAGQGAAEAGYPQS